VIKEYIALSQPKTKPAELRINRLKNITISPTEKPVFLSKIMAMISVPSNDPLFLIIIPTPIPINIPPKTEARSTSSVILGNDAK